MRRLFSSLMLGVGLAVGLAAQGYAQTSTTRQVSAMVEALRQAAPKTQKPNDGLYSDWQVKPGTIAAWSKSCLKRQVTPTQFESNPALARQVITCVIQDEFNQRLRSGAQDETSTVQAVACWWMTGNDRGCNRGTTANYVRTVTQYYRKLRS